MRIVKAAKKHAKAISEMMLAELKNPNRRFPKKMIYKFRKHAELGSVSKEFDNPNLIGLAAFHKNKFAGFIVGYKEKRTAMIHYVAGKSMKIKWALLKRLIIECKKRDIYSILADTFEFMENNLLFKEAGFTLIKKEQVGKLEMLWYLLIFKNRNEDRRRCRVYRKMKLPKNTNFYSFDIIFIGDTHGYIDDFKVQKEVIKKANPDYVLHEQMNNKGLVKKSDFLSALKQKNISALTETKEVEPLIKLCMKKNMPLIGIDYQNFGIKWAKRFKNKVDNSIKFTHEEKKELKAIQEKREEKQLRMVQKYAKKGRIAVITGSYHLRRNSPLIKGTKHFLAIMPQYEGDLIFGPIVDKRKLRYGVIQK